MLRAVDTVAIKIKHSGVIRFDLSFDIESPPVRAFLAKYSDIGEEYLKFSAGTVKYRETFAAYAARDEAVSHSVSFPTAKLSFGCSFRDGL